MKTSERKRWGRGYQITLNCERCGKEFTTKATHEGRRKYCSFGCRPNKERDKAEEMTKLASKVEFSPAESQKIRTQICNYMSTQLEDANAVVMGAKSWNPTQARVFGILLNKVIPDLNASFHQHEHSTKALTDLSREELEAIAQGVSTIEAEYTEIEQNEDNEQTS